MFFIYFENILEEGEKTVEKTVILQIFFFHNRGIKLCSQKLHSKVQPMRSKKFFFIEKSIVKEFTSWKAPKIVIFKASDSIIDPRKLVSLMNQLDRKYAEDELNGKDELKGKDEFGVSHAAFTKTLSLASFKTYCSFGFSYESKIEVNRFENKEKLIRTIDR